MSIAIFLENGLFPLMQNELLGVKIETALELSMFNNIRLSSKFEIKPEFIVSQLRDLFFLSFFLSLFKGQIVAACK